MSSWVNDSAASQSAAKKVFFQDIFTWTGTQAIPTATFQNFFSLSGVAKESGGTAGITLSAGAIKLPAATDWSQVIFSFRINGTIGGSSGTTREWFTQTRRINGTEIVGSCGDVKVSGSDISNRDSILASWTMDELDPFTVNGTQAGIFNDSGQTITLTSARIRVQRIINP